jgi:hypothetical protein
MWFIGRPKKEDVKRMQPDVFSISHAGRLVKENIAVFQWVRSAIGLRQQDGCKRGHEVQTLLAVMAVPFRDTPWRGHESSGGHGSSLCVHRLAVWSACFPLTGEAVSLYD